MRPYLHRFPALGGLLLFALLCTTIAGPKSFRGNAATLIVTNTNDNGAGSLRDTIAAANDGDTIQFDAALNGQTISLTSGELAINKNIAITGPGRNLLQVFRSGSIRFRIFSIMSGRTVTIGGLTITGGRTWNTNGAGILNYGTLSLVNCGVSSNVAQGPLNARGGGICNEGELTIADSTITNNDGSDGGGIDNTGALTIVNSSIVWNLARNGSSGNAGGIYVEGGSLELTTSAVTENASIVAGGGIFSNDGTTVTITDSTISDNNGGSRSGAIQIGGISSGNGVTVDIRNSTISGNYAVSDGGINNAGTLTLVNSTLSGNFAYGNVGGIGNDGLLTIISSTISGNGTNGSVSGISNSNSGTLQVGNTVLNAESGANVLNDGGTVTSHGYNLSSDNGGGFLTGPGDQINTDPMLGPLQNNGGPTFTHELLSGSPAIDAGDPSFTPPPFTDQRGFLRVYNGRIDTGSFEVQSVPTPTPSATPSLPLPQLANISTRLGVETGDGVGISGFIIHGAGSLQVAIRGLGPSLGQLGIPGFLPDPILELRDGTGGLLLQNDNWQDDPAGAGQLMQLGLAPGDPLESALIVTLPPGPYTAIAAGKNGGTGIGLVEVYNVDHSVPVGNIDLANISTRGLVGTGDNVMIGGFILAGASSENAQIVIRGIGPSLTPFGITNALADPTLELRDSNGALLIANDNWQDDPASAAELTAHGLAPSDPLESGIFISLSPGLYTAILAGQNAGTGVGLVEVYDLQ